MHLIFPPGHKVCTMFFFTAPLSCIHMLNKNGNKANTVYSPLFICILFICIFQCSFIATHTIVVCTLIFSITNTIPYSNTLHICFFYNLFSFPIFFLKSSKRSLAISFQFHIIGDLCGSVKSPVTVSSCWVIY